MPGAPADLVAGRRRRWIPESSAPGGVPLHPARIRAGLEDPVGLAPDGGDAAQRPGARHLDVVPAPAQAFDRLGADALLDCDVPWKSLARIEAGGKRLGVVARRVDRGLEVEALVDVGEEGVERPL